MDKLKSLFLTIFILCAALTQAQTVESRSLTDKIHRGQGTINLLKDIGGADLKNYFDSTGKLLLLGVDVNEDNSGNENSKSLGIAIKDAQLKITTSAGEFTFKDFFTSTSSAMKETGSSSLTTYQTMFGQTIDFLADFFEEGPVVRDRD